MEISKAIDRIIDYYELRKTTSKRDIFNIWEDISRLLELDAWKALSESRWNKGRVSVYWCGTDKDKMIWVEKKLDAICRLDRDKIYDILFRLFL